MADRSPSLPAQDHHENPHRGESRDQLSADPAVWTEFSTKFAKRYGCEPASPEEARSFRRNWLAGQAQRHEFYRGPLVEAFDSAATPQEWKAALIELKDG